MVWVSYARHYYICEIKGECGPPPLDIDSSFIKNIPKTLNLTAGKYKILKDYPEFYFDYGSHAYTSVEGNESFLDSVAVFLVEHPDDSIKITVTGYYLKSEEKNIKDSKLYNDLGIARAQTIIDKLIEEYKIPAHRLKAASKEISGETVLAPLGFNIEGYLPFDAAENQEDTLLLEQIKTSVKNITYSDKTAKFDYNSGKFTPHASFDIYLDSLKSYLERHPKDYLVVIGHTDSKGNDSYNKKLGMERAKAVKAHLEKKGIKVQIKTESQGKKNLAEKDRNPDGTYNLEAMAKNRRVNIVIKTK